MYSKASIAWFLLFTILEKWRERSRDISEVEKVRVSKGALFFCSADTEEERPTEDRSWSGWRATMRISRSSFFTFPFPFFLLCACVNWVMSLSAYGFPSTDFFSFFPFLFLFYFHYNSYDPRLDSLSIR